MKSEISVPEEVSEEETLGRSIASTREERNARKGVIIPSVFLDRRPVQSLSVDRMDHAPRSEMARIAADREGRRNPPRPFQGWALISAQNASRSARTVAASPKKNENPFHSHILLNLKESDAKNMLRRKKEHALELASRSTWEEAPRPAKKAS